MSSSIQPTSPTFSNFAESIVASGLVPGDELNLACAAAKEDPHHLAKILKEKGLLTEFQVLALNEGRGASLRVGNYDIMDRLGAGGMGTVFKARHRRMKRIVALKVLAAKLSENPVFVKRFQREVETIASLGHPNVVMAYDADEAEVGHFLVMEFVNGRDLAALVEKDGTLPLSEAVDCLLQAARGLAYAHSQNIIHRDIKPHNLLRDKDGIVKVTDLGLARLNHGEDGPAAGNDVTMAGGVIGTPDYMPPEQAIDSTTIDHRADIYSLGCTLHFLLTGKPPYSGPTMMSILLKHRDAEVPTLSTMRPETSLALDQLFRRMLAKRPDDRLQKMSEVVAKLQAIASGLVSDQMAQGHPGATVVLPVSSGTLVETASSTVHSPGATVAIDVNGGRITALIVEPSRVQASIIKGYLQEQSVEIVGTAANGKDAIELVQKLQPGAVLSAMYLSDISGVELAQRIRSENKNSPPGFVLITSEADDAESAAITRLNRVLMLPKPFTAAQLSDALKLVTGATATNPLGRETKRKTRNELRVLIVDDTAPARIQVRTVLQGLGFTQFLEVPDGAHAIAVAARENCDLIVTDYNMPLMDGRALVSYLKQNPATAAVPIVMVTTETEPRVLDPVRRLGVAAIVEKAFPASVVGPLLDSLF